MERKEKGFFRMNNFADDDDEKKTKLVMTNKSIISLSAHHTA